MKYLQSNTTRPVDRRSFMKSGLLAGGAAAVGAGLLANGTSARAQERGRLGKGDAAILRFLAAAELIESDLWTQYAELGGIGNNRPIEVTNPNPPQLNNYQTALSNLDSDGPQYITSNTLDEVSHAAFLNAYLESRGAQPVDFSEFTTLQGSIATGSSGKLRLTNLTQLNVDTSWYVRYRSTTNPDLGATFPQAITLNNVTAIPRNNDDFNDTQPYSGNRECGRVSLRIHRARRLQSLRNHESKSVGSRGVGDHAWHRRGRDRSLPGVGRFRRQWSAAAPWRRSPTPFPASRFPISSTIHH